MAAMSEKPTSMHHIWDLLQIEDWQMIYHLKMTGCKIKSEILQIRRAAQFAIARTFCIQSVCDAIETIG